MTHRMYRNEGSQISFPSCYQRANKDIQIIQSIVSMDWGTVEKLAPTSASLIDTQSSLKLPLHFAVSQCNVPIEIVNCLIRAYPRGCNQKDKSGKLPLHCALESRAELPVISALVNAFAEACSVPDSRGKLPIHYAVSQYQPASQFSSQSKVKSNCTIQCSKLKDFEEFSSQNLELITIILNAYPEGASAIDYKKKIPLHYAAENGLSIEVIEMLLSLFPFGSVMQDESRRLPLHYVMTNPNPSIGIVEVLVVSADTVASLVSPSTSTKSNLSSIRTRWLKKAEDWFALESLASFPLARSDVAMICKEPTYMVLDRFGRSPLQVALNNRSITVEWLDAYGSMIPLKYVIPVMCTKLNSLYETSASLGINRPPVLETWFSKEEPPTLTIPTAHQLQKPKVRRHHQTKLLRQNFQREISQEIDLWGVDNSLKDGDQSQIDWSCSWPDEGQSSMTKFHVDKTDSGTAFPIQEQLFPLELSKSIDEDSATEDYRNIQDNNIALQYLGTLMKRLLKNDGTKVPVRSNSNILKDARELSIEDSAAWDCSWEAYDKKPKNQMHIAIKAKIPASTASLYNDCSDADMFSYCMREVKFGCIDSVKQISTAGWSNHMDRVLAIWMLQQFDSKDIKSAIKEQCWTVVQAQLECSKDETIESDCDDFLHLAVMHRCVPVRIVTAILSIHLHAGSSLGANGRVPLHTAILSQCSLDVIEELIKKCPESVLISDNMMRLPLHYACTGNVRLGIVVQLLKVYPAGVNCPDNSGQLPLHVAVAEMRSAFETIDLLLNANRDACTIPDNKGRLPLHYIVKSNSRDSPAIVRRMLQIYTEAASKRDSCGKLPLHWIGYAGSTSLEVISALLTAYPAGASIQDHSGNISLHAAIIHPSISPHILDLLIKSNPIGSIPVICSLWSTAKSLKYVKYNILQICLESIVRAGKQDGEEAFVRYALLLSVRGGIEVLRHHVACHLTKEKDDIVRLLDEFKIRDIFSAITSRNWSLTCNLLKMGCDIPDKNGRFPLHCAVIESSVPVVVITELLKEYASAASTPDSSGMLPLHCAVRSGVCVEVLKKLVLAYPAGVWALDDRNMMPMQSTTDSSVISSIVTLVNWHERKNLAVVRAALVRFFGSSSTSNPPRSSSNSPREPTLPAQHDTNTNILMPFFESSTLSTSQSILSGPDGCSNTTGITASRIFYNRRFCRHLATFLGAKYEFLLSSN